MIVISEFIAEAQVLITPNVAAFAATLKAEVEAAVKAAGPITIPVVPAATAATGAVAAQAQAVAAANTQVAASNQAVAQTATAAAAATNQNTAALVRSAAAATQKTAADRAAEIAERSLILSRRAVAAGERRLLTTSSELAGARVRATAANTALTRAETALAEIRNITDPVLARQIQLEHALAVARQEDALRALQAAEANAALAASQNKAATAANAAAAAEARRQTGFAKGAAATGLAAAGARGATLAASGPFLAGAAVVVGLGASLKAASDLEVQLNVLRVTAQATGQEMAAVAAESRTLGADISLPGVSASDAAQAMTELAKAGLDVQDSIEGARGVLQLAAAAGIDNAAATELAASALNAFGLAGEEATHVADVFANAANQSQGSIVDIGTAFQQAAAVARLAGVSFEDTASLLTLLARNGLQGSDAGTSLRTAFIRLINPTKEAAALLGRLNINVRDISGNIRPEVFAEFAEATRDMGRAQRDAATAIVFGQDAIRAAAILGREGATSLDEVTEALGREGAAAELAAARAQGLAGEASALKSNLETLAATIGGVLTPTVTGFVKGLNFAISGLNRGTDAIRDFLSGNDFDALNADLEGIQARFAEIEESRLDSGFIPPSLAKESEELEERIREIGKALLESAHGSQALITEFSRVSPAISRALRDGIITPAEEAEIAVDALGRAFLSIAPDQLFSGGASAVRKAVAGMADALKGGAADLEQAFLNEFFPPANRAGKQVGAAFVAGVKASISDLSGLDLAIAQAGGSQGDELGILRERETRQDTFLNRLLRREQTPKNVALATKAAENLGRTRDAITSILDEQDRAAQEQANKIKEQANESDRKVLEGLEAGGRGVATQALIAEGTASLQDDIDAANATIANNKRRIAVIGKSVQDKQKAAALINDLKDENIKLNQQIAADTRAIFEGGFEPSPVLAAQISLAQATGNIDAQITLIDVQIRKINELIRKQKLQGEALNRAKAQRETLKAQREDLENQQIQERIALGQSILDLTGNRNPILRAIEAAIAETQRDIAAAKRAGRSTVTLQTELNNFFKQRKDVLEEAKKDADDATTAFDLLQGAAETFRSTGGNLIGGNQPFAGPTGFTADLAQFLRRQQPRAVQIDTSDVVGRAVERQITSLDRLSDVIERDIESRTGNTGTGEGAPGSTYARITGQRAAAMGRFWQSTQARRVKDGGML